MRKEIKSYFENLRPEQLGLKEKIKVKSIGKLGMGTGNLNYLIKVNNEKFVFRMNMGINMPKKSKREFEALRIVEKYKIGPKAWVLDESKKEFDSDFIIISYIWGRTVNATKEYLKPKMFGKIGNLCGKLHAIKIEGKLRKLQMEDEVGGYQSYLKLIDREYVKYFNSKTKNEKLLRLINESYKEISTKVPSGKYERDVVLSQGDFCEQNVVVYKNQYKLIDFEDLELTDRSGSLAHIFVDFGRPFDDNQKEMFLKEYLKLNKIDKEKLLNKIDIWIPLKLFLVFLWSIKHVMRIKEKEMHKHFIENDDMANNLSYVGTMFKRCLRFGIIDKKYESFDLVGELK